MVARAPSMVKVPFPDSGVNRIRNNPLSTERFKIK